MLNDYFQACFYVVYCIEKYKQSSSHDSIKVQKEQKRKEDMYKKYNR